MYHTFKRWSGVVESGLKNMKKLVFVPAVLFVLVACAVGAETNRTPKIKVKETITYYSVSSLNANKLHRQMERKGPNGYWGYATWDVLRSHNCDLLVVGEIELPRHTRPDRMSRQLRQDWDKMIEALLAHERQHLAHGLAAAKEIAEATCENAIPILEKWAEQDRVLDLETDHGSLTGVNLPIR